MCGGLVVMQARLLATLGSTDQAGQRKGLLKACGVTCNTGLGRHEECSTGHDLAQQLHVAKCSTALPMQCKVRILLIVSSLHSGSP